jgi:hypothetical protein
MKRSLLIFSAVLIAMTSVCYGETLILQLNDRFMNGQSALSLKQEAMRQYPHTDLRNFKLDFVRLMIKSQYGRGLVQLQIGGNIASARVNGTPYVFSNPDPRTFSDVFLTTQDEGGMADWTLYFTGDSFIVRQALLSLKSNPPARVSRCEGYTPERSCTGRDIYTWTPPYVNRSTRGEDCLELCNRKLRELNWRGGACCQLQNHEDYSVNCKLRDGVLSGGGDSIGAANCDVVYDRKRRN